VTTIDEQVIDVLGEPYRRRIIELPDDDEGPVIATLVSRRAPTPTTRAVLYVHGFTDYFFQTHLADFFTGLGFDFYAIDLRKYGRSLLAHQTPNFTRAISEYFPELDRAVEIIRSEEGHDQLLVAAHSTGGLITALWAHARAPQNVVDGLLLNSPFFDINAEWLIRRPAIAAVSTLASRLPYRVIPLNSPGFYGRSLHRDSDGEWDYNLEWKPLGGFPVRVAWLAAIRSAQRRLQAGLDIAAPILVAHAGTSYRQKIWTDAAHESDAVLNVEHIIRFSSTLGRHVTIARIDGGKHDLALSREPARKRFFDETERWMSAYLTR
jgi:alpha-beta hydrolase superfamily lysophospholipase